MILMQSVKHGDQLFLTKSKAAEWAVENLPAAQGLKVTSVRNGIGLAIKGQGYYLKVHWKDYSEVNS